MFHPLLWGWWAFSVKHASTVTGLVNFSAGGWQEARGGSVGQHFYIENLLEELDFLREWHATESELYYMPAAEESVVGGRLGAATDGDWAEQVVTAPMLETVVRVQGTMTQPVRHLRFAGLTIAHSTTTYMEPYEVPSGGDWAVHRGAAFVVEGAEDISISNCTMDQPGGNGLLLSDYTRNCTVHGNEFAFSGDSAIVSIGRAQRLLDPENHTDGLFPAGNTISHNYIHDVGVFGKRKIVILSRFVVLPVSPTLKASPFQRRLVTSNPSRAATRSSSTSVPMALETRSTTMTGSLAIMQCGATSSSMQVRDAILRFCRHAFEGAGVMQCARPTTRDRSINGTGPRSSRQSSANGAMGPRRSTRTSWSTT